MRWLQEARQPQPSTVSRRLSVVIGYRTCVIDGILDHSPADYVRRPTVPPESPTQGLSPRAIGILGEDPQSHLLAHDVLRGPSQGRPRP